MENHSIIDKLNAEQRAVCLEEGNILLTACAGSGKTRTITHRLAYLQNKYPNSQKYNIAITYTNRAADEIYSRLDNMGIDTSAIWTGTIHQFCINFIIRPYSMYSERLCKGYSIIDEFTVNKYCHNIANNLGITLKAYDNPFTHYEIRSAYNDLLLKNKELDFDLILECSLELLKKNPFISENISSIIRTIHVDEYQDTNELQYSILSEIYKSQNKICLLFVGDVNQAIYGNLGGVAKSKKELESIFETSFKQMHLRGCYRSTQQIIDFYKDFEVNPTGIVSVSKIKDEYSEISYNKSISQYNLPNEIARIIRKELSNGVPQNEICVLAPQWRYIFNLTNILKNLLPDISFDAPEISPFKYDPLNPFYILARLVFSEAGKNINIRKKLAKEFLEIIKNDYNIEISNRYDFLDLLKNANSKDITEKNGISVYEKAVEHIFRSMKVSLSDNEKLLQTYKLFIEKSNNRMAKNDLSSDYDDICSFFKEKQGVVISTIHGVKGEEYNTVIGFGLLNGVIPHWDYILKSDLKPIRESETKKLLYVLMSRAKQNLFLFSENDRITKNGSPLSPTDELSKIQ